MSTIPLMTTGDERRLLAAVEAAAADPAADDGPDAALAKAAADAGVPEGHVPLLVRAYNTSRAAFQREGAADVAEKAASFPVASVDAVLRALRPAPPAPGPAKEAGVSPEYASAPSWYRTPDDRGRAGRACEVLKQAAGARDAARSAPRLDDEAFRTAYRRADSELARVERRRSELHPLRVDALRALEKVADAIDRPGAPAWADVKEVVDASMGAYASIVLGEVARMRPKLAAAPPRDPYHDVRAHAGLYSAVRAAADAGVALVEARAALAAESEAVRRKVAEDLAPFAADADGDDDKPDGEASLGLVPGGPAIVTTPPAGGERTDPLLGEAPVKEAFLPQVAVGLTIAQLRDGIQRLGEQPTFGGPAEPRIQEALDKLRDPVHDARLRGLEDQYAIHDMLLNDDVIGSHDPEDVAAVVNEIARTAPRQVVRPMLSRPLIRRALEMGGLDTFDAGEAVNVEHKLHQLGHPAGGPAAPKPPAAASSL